MKSHESSLRRSFALTIFLSAATAACGSTSAGTNLKWKFKEGQTLNYQIEQKVVTKTHTEAQDTRFSMTQLVDMSFTVKSLLGDGKAKIAQKFNRLRVKIDGPLGHVDFDSSAKVPEESKDEKDSQNPSVDYARQAAPVMKILLGTEFTIIMNEQGEVLDAQIPESITKMLSEGQDKSAFNAEDFIKKNLLQTAIKLPKEPVSEGAAWKDLIEVPIEPVGKSLKTRTYTYKGEATKSGAKYELINLDVKSKFEPSENKNLQIKFEFKSSSEKGEFLFDNEQGHLHDSNVLTEDKVEVQNGGQTMSQDVLVSTKFTYSSPNVK
jgi:hypothetical protein